jgi:diguanylate cyclase (GGDEF)-like protein
MVIDRTPPTSSGTKDHVDGDGEDDQRPKPTRRFHELRPHVKIALVGLVLVVSAGTLLVVILSRLDKIAAPAELAETRLSPARDELVTLDQGLGDTQFSLQSVLLSTTPEDRVRLIEDLRRQLSLNDEAWRRFQSLSLRYPGEEVLWAEYEALDATVNDLAGPVGLLLIQSSDPSALFTSPEFVEIREAQRAAQLVVQRLDAEYYAPNLDASLTETNNDIESARGQVLLAFAVAMALSSIIVAASWRSARDRQRETERDVARRASDARRNELEARLYRALEMSSTEEGAYRTVALALEQAVPDHPAEMLVSDSSEAHFRQVLSTDRDGHGPGCPVVSPGECPATHRSDTLVFTASTDLDACPYLIDRPGGPVAAVCQPINIAGKSLAVVHVTFPVNEPPPGSTITDLELISRRVGDRVGLLRAFAESESQAKSDPLTGLLNRRSLENAVRRLPSDDADYCVAFGDLDRFKALNDTHGHGVGDRALRLFAKVLRDSIRPNDLACRYGGEEFLIVLPECAVEEARRVVERVRSALRDALLAGGIPEFTVSFGLASSEQASSFERVVALADEALLGAKSAGRDRVLVAGAGPAALPSGPPPAAEP